MAQGSETTEPFFSCWMNMLQAGFHVICLDSVPACRASSFPAPESNHDYSEGMSKKAAPPLVPGEKGPEDTRKQQEYRGTQKAKKKTRKKKSWYHFPGRKKLHLTYCL